MIRPFLTKPVKKKLVINSLLFVFCFIIVKYPVPAGIRYLSNFVMGWTCLSSFLLLKFSRWGRSATEDTESEKIL